MADSYSTRLRTRLQETNANKNTWGAYLNTGALQLLDDSIAGWANVDLSSANATLTTGNGVTDEARMAVIRAYGSGTTTRTITIPSLEKCYKVKNDYDGIVLIKTAAGTGVVVLPGQYAEVWCNATECYRAWVNSWGLASTVSTASGSGNKVVSLEVTGQQFTDARLVVNTSVSATGLNIQINGSGGSSGTTTLYSGLSFNGVLEIPGFLLDNGFIENGLSTASGTVAVAPVVAANAPRIQWKSTGGIQNLTIYADAGAGSFTAGSIKVYLRG